MIPILRYLFFTAFLSIATSCAKEEGDTPDRMTTRTVMVYMAANNSLAAEAYKNINQMEEGFKAVDGKLIVYARLFGQQPKLYEIAHDTSPEIKSKVLKTYNDHDSSNPEIMKMVFADIKAYARAPSYAAILWSHATNWAPADLGQVSVRSFGDDNYSRMDVQQLKEALPANLDYLIFDACSMASVEVLYELRDVAPYILASPTEVLSVGMPYDQIYSLLYHEDVKMGLRGVAEAYVNYYKQKKGEEQSATFSLVDTKQMEQLAATTKALLTTYEYRLPAINRNAVQRMDLDQSSPVVAFDFIDLFEQQLSDEEIQPLYAAVDRVVVYKAHTDTFLGQPIRAFSGLSTYVPVAEEGHLKPFYQTLSWFDAAAYGLLFRW